MENTDIKEVALNLKRPLIFFDLETTGLNVTTDRIVEISVVKVYPEGHPLRRPDGEPEVKTHRINPEIHISEQATAIHGITDEDVKDCPTFKQYARNLAKYMEGCDIAGFNSTQFDIPMLEEEFIRAGVEYDFSRCRLIDVQTIFHKMEKRTLAAAYMFYCNKDLEDAHSAEADTLATYHVLKAQLGKYAGQIENDVEKLAEFTSNNKLDYAGRIIKNEAGEPVFNFGKHKGRLVKEVLEKEPSYYDWMMKGEFPQNTKKVLTRIKIEGTFNKNKI